MKEKLFQAGQIGKIRLKNRVVMPAMGCGFASANGEASEGIIQFYEERAKGGCGLIITEITRIDDETGVGLSNQLAVTKPYQIQRLSYLADRIHKYDSKIFVQLHHPGRQTPRRLLNGLQAVAPSAIPCGVVKEMPRELTVEEIKALVKKFVVGAYMVKTAGCDGVEIHAAHGYLISQFLSPYTNKRTDEYGGNFENRTRFLTEIILGIRHTLGPDFPICVRMNGTDFLEGGLELADQVKLAKLLESLGVDALNVSSGMYESGWSIIEPSALPEAWKKDLAKTIKSQVNIPVIAVNNIKHPAVAEQLLEEGVCDFVGIARGQLCDPEFTNKAERGDQESIRKCLGCLYCFKVLNQGRPLACTINPVLGREFMFRESDLKVDGDGRKVAIVGGGPAGMQAAITLAKRGFKPVIYEAQDKLGGMMNLGDQPPFKSLMTEFCTTLQREVKDLAIELKLGQKVKPEDLQLADYYGVVVACGGEPIVPPVKGVDSANVYNFEEVLRGDVELKDKNLIVLGGGETGLETAELLSDRGNKVTVVEMLDAVGKDLYASVLAMMMKRFQEKGLQVVTGHKVVEWAGDEVVLQKTVDDQETQTIKADGLVIASGVKPNRDLVESFRQADTKVLVVGDAYATGNIADALKEANDKCWVF